MNVEYKEKKNGVALATLGPGDCFDYNGDLYLAVDADYYLPTDRGDSRMFAVKLDDGEFVGLGVDTEVLPVKNARVVVK